MLIDLAWVIDAAQQWEVRSARAESRPKLNLFQTSTFVGVDIVPVQPDLETVALEPSLRDRVHWVNANL